MYRKFNKEKDQKAAHRIWLECGWIEDEKKYHAMMDRFVGLGSAWVYEMNGAAEALTLSAKGTMHHMGTPLSLTAITAVTTSRVARNQGAASGTLARALAEAGAKGSALAGLGCFEQGFYDRLGFGTGSYVQGFQFDPAWLKPMGRPAPPVRLSPKDFKAIHQGLLARKKYHGAVDLTPADFIRCELEWDKNVFGLGYKQDGKLTHFFVAGTEDVEEGPYRVGYLAYRSVDQLKELLALIRGLGDQIRVVRMHEPVGVQIQTLLKKPFQLQGLTHGGKHPTRHSSNAYWQLRMMDVRSCITVLSVAADLEFNLTVDDPIVDHLPKKSKWPGCGGMYTVHLGATTRCSKGHSGGLRELRCSINDLTRFWIGAASAEVLATFGSFAADGSLIQALDEAVQLPTPVPDWDY